MKGTGSQANVVTNKEAIKTWKQQDCQARGYLLSTTEVTQHKLLLACRNAHEMWEALSAQHINHAANNQYDLQARFYDYRHQPSKDMKYHIAEIKNLAHLVADVGLPLTEQQIVTKIVCTLPQTFQSFISSWRHLPKDGKTLAVLTTSLLQEERSLAKWKNQDNVSGDVPTQEAALAVQPPTPPFSSNNYKDTSNRRRGRGASHNLRGSYTQTRQNQSQRRWNGERSPEQIVCGYCHKPNHTEEECRTKQRHERVKKEIEDLKKNTKRDNGAIAMDTTCNRRRRLISFLLTFVCISSAFLNYR